MKTEIFLGKLAEVLLASPGGVKFETRLDSLAGWDSMGQVATLSFLDEELGAKLPAGSLQKCQTLGDIVCLVKERLTD